MNKSTCFLVFMVKKTKSIVALPLFLVFLLAGLASNAQNRISLAVGQSYTLPAPTHFGARIYSAQWSCNTTDVSAQTLADFSGRITVVRAFTGDVRVTCYYSYSYTINGFSYTGTSAEYYLVECSSGGGGGGGGSGNETGVSLNPMSKNIDLNNPYATDYSIGACALPAGAQSTFTWTSTNPSVATVKITSTTANCSNGYIVAYSEGSCYIKVTTANGYTEKCLVKVTSNGGGGGSNNETGVSLSAVPDTIYLNNPQVGISACAVPSNAQTTFAWSTTNSSVATVKITNETANCSNGYIVANGVGTCYIKVITAKGYTQQRKVTVANVPVNNGDKFMVNGIAYKKLTNTSCEVTYNDSGSTGLPTPTYSGNISIPSQVSYGGTTYNVTIIGRNAFLGCASLASITIPSSVTTIGDSAFVNCIGLASVTIPGSVTTIGNGAFSVCSSLASVTIPSSVTTIGYQAFSACTSLKVITVSSGNTKYSSQDGVLYNMDKTELICCPEGYSGIVNIPNTVTTIGDYAFYNCSTLASVTIPNSVTTIRNYAFYNVKMIYYQGAASGQPWGALCMNGYLEDSLYYSNSLKTNLISAHSAITKALIPNTVTTIGDYAFYNCSALASVTIPSSVTTIGANAFSYCNSLTSVTIPSSVTTINSAFMWCSSLTDITVSSENVWLSSQDGILYSKNKMQLICCPGGKDGSIIIPGSVKRIGAYAFRNCTRLTSVTIPSSVTCIDAYVFDGCQMEIWMKHTTPPQMGEQLIANSGSLVFVVPHKAYKDYLKAGINYTRHRICCDTIMVTATVNDTTSGYIVGVEPVYAFPYAIPLQIELKAEHYQGHRFVQWNDGVTTNPRLVTLLCDTAFTACFQGVGVSESEDGDVPFAYAESGCVVVKNLQNPELVEISDITGRRLFRGMVSETGRIPVRASAVYFVRIGSHPVQKVVLIR